MVELLEIGRQDSSMKMTKEVMLSEVLVNCSVPLLQRERRGGGGGGGEEE